MERKTIFLELPIETLEKIDHHNNTDDRSSFITGLLNKQLDTLVSTMNMSTEIVNTMQNQSLEDTKPGEINILNNKGQNMGKFNINTLEGFENLAKKICEISDDPIVRMKTRRLR